MILEKEKFLSLYKIDEERFYQANLDWNELQKIHNDFQGRYEQLSQAARMAAESIRMAPGVHSIRYRIKEPEHLIEKIIRKKIKNPLRNITTETYLVEITDLIGIRALHLFKDDWFPIHQFILNTWELHETPKTYIRTGDVVPEIYHSNTEVEPHEFGYRSVHYLIKNSPYKNQLITEVQVRTIFEEGWSEIDHTIRYPYDLDNHTINSFLQIFNRLAGSADEMGTYINYLKNELELKDRRHTNELEEKNRLIESLESKISQISEIGKEEKAKLLGEVAALRQKVNAVPNFYFSKGMLPLPNGFNFQDGNITVSPNIVGQARFTLNPGTGKWIYGGFNPELSSDILGPGNSLYAEYDPDKNVFKTVISGVEKGLKKTNSEEKN